MAFQNRSIILIIISRVPVGRFIYVNNRHSERVDDHFIVISNPPPRVITSKRGVLNLIYSSVGRRESRVYFR